MNLWGVSESAKVFALPTLLFIAAILMVIVAGLVRSHPAVTLTRTLPPVSDTVGTLLILKAHHGARPADSRWGGAWVPVLRGAR